MSSFTRRIGVLIAATALVLTASGCGPQTVDMPASQQVSNDEPCFGELTPQQKAELATYAASNGDKIAELETDESADVDSVCILQADGSGQLTARYYDEDEAESHFSEYMLMSMLLGRNNSAILTYGVLTGDISLGEMFALQMLFGYNNHGAYPMYDRGSDNSWVRNERPQTYGSYVSKVQYGKQAPVPVDKAIFQPKPAGFNTWKMPPFSQRVATFDKTGVLKADTSKTRAGYTKLTDSNRVPVGYKPAPRPAAGSGSVSGSGSGVSGGSAPKASVRAPAPAPTPAPAPKRKTSGKKG